MATSTELKDSLQRISALMGLLRSDFLELSEAKSTRQRGPIVEHIQWIADQLDELRDELAADKPRRSHAAHAHSTEAEPKHTARHNAKHHGESVETPPIPDDPKQPDVGLDDVDLLKGEPAPMPEEPQPAAAHDEAAAIPPPPDVPKPRDDDKPH